MKLLNRDYNAESERQKTVEEFYRVQHINQTYDYVSAYKRLSTKKKKLLFRKFSNHLFSYSKTFFKM